MTIGDHASGDAAVLSAVAAGGGLGAAARYGLTLAWPTPPHGFPWSTFTANAVGCALIGMLMAVIAEVGIGHRLWRPFLGVGLLGGFTTFSTYAVGVRDLLVEGHPGLAAGYLASTVTGAVIATWLGVVVARRLAGRHR